MSKNARKCGRVRCAANVDVVQDLGTERVHNHGLVRCGSWHSCPWCSLQIAMERAAEVRAIADRHRAAGGALYLATFTVPHDQGDRLAPLRRAVADAYRYTHAGAGWLAMQGRVRYVGEVRALECTVGVNGWHPHIHVLLFTAEPLTDNVLAQLRDYLAARWARRLTRAGYRLPSAEHGVTIVRSHRDDYLAKMGIADELTKGSTKTARGSSRTPLQVLDDFRQTGDVADRDLWREWVEGMHGAKQLTWSSGRHDLRALYGTEPECSDEAIVAGDSQRPELHVATIPGELWDRCMRNDPDFSWKHKDAAEQGGRVALDQLITDTLATRRRRWAA